MIILIILRNKCTQKYVLKMKTVENVNKKFFVHKKTS